jgi:hypothetical protein
MYPSFGARICWYILRYWGLNLCSIAVSLLRAMGNIIWTNTRRNTRDGEASTLATVVLTGGVLVGPMGIGLSTEYMRVLNWWVLLHKDIALFQQRGLQRLGISCGTNRLCFTLYPLRPFSLRLICEPTTSARAHYEKCGRKDGCCQARWPERDVSSLCDVMLGDIFIGGIANFWLSLSLPTPRLQLMNRNKAIWEQSGEANRSYDTA